MLGTPEIKLIIAFKDNQQPSGEFVNSRICSDCRIEKPISQFGFSKTKAAKGAVKAAYSYICKNCTKARNRLYYLEHKQKILEQVKAYQENHREELRPLKFLAHRQRYMMYRRKVFEHYGLSCKCCGELTFELLTIDHINNDGEEHRRQIGQAQLYPWLVKNSFPEGFQTLCHNCNFGKMRYGICPHKFTEGPETIPSGSTPQAIGGGSARHSKE